MKTCPHSNLPIIENPHWVKKHPEAGYEKSVQMIGQDIMHVIIKADHPVTLDFMDTDLLKTVLHEQGLNNIRLYLIWDMTSVEDISYQYKKNITDLLYHWEPIFSCVVFYNTQPSCRPVIETFAAVVPDNIKVFLEESYEQGIRLIMNFKSGILPEAAGQDEHTLMTKEFLAATARISWFNMFNQQIFLPPEGSHYYPFFKALANMQKDLKAQDESHEKQYQQLRYDCEQRVTQKTILLNAQVELHRKESFQSEQEKSALKSRIASQDMELTRISTAIAEKTSALHFFCEQIKILDIESPLKQKLLEQCQSMIETELTEKRLKTELTAGDSEFLSKLQKKHPNLNQRELRVSLMVKLNYDTREIARSIGISTRGMESIRYRMHKKLGLDKHKSIKTYLSELSTL